GVSITINGNTQNTTINDATGDFSLNYNPSTIPASGAPYTITYSYIGNGTTLSGAVNTGTMLTVNAAASSTALVSSQNPSTETSNVTFTATVSSSGGTPAGDVVFLTNGVPFTTNTLSGGTAAFNTGSLPAGTNIIAAQ